MWMRVVGLAGVEARLGSGALGLALDRLHSLLGGYCRYQYWWSAWTGAVGRSLVGAELETVSGKRVLGGESGRKNIHKTEEYGSII